MRLEVASFRCINVVTKFDDVEMTPFHGCMSRIRCVKKGMSSAHSSRFNRIVWLRYTVCTWFIKLSSLSTTNANIVVTNITFMLIYHRFYSRRYGLRNVLDEVENILKERII
jgi:hypothetical protein